MPPLTTTIPSYGTKKSGNVTVKKIEPSKPSVQIKRAAPAPSVQIDFEIGDRVMHKVFGEGTLLSKKPMGGDTLLEVNFDKAGTKKIMANFAKLTKAE